MGLVQSQAKPKSWPTKVPVGVKNMEFGWKWVENRRFGLKQEPNESYGLSGPTRTTPEAKNGFKNAKQKLETGLIMPGRASPQWLPVAPSGSQCLPVPPRGIGRFLERLALEELSHHIHSLKRLEWLNGSSDVV